MLQVPEEVPNARAEVSELQLMADNQTNLEVTTEQNNQRLPHTGSRDKSMRMHKLIQQIRVF